MQVASFVLAMLALGVSVVALVLNQRNANNMRAMDKARRLDELRPTFTATHTTYAGKDAVEFRNEGPMDYQHVHYAIVVTEHEPPAVQWIFDNEAPTKTGDLGRMPMGSAQVRSLKRTHESRGGDVRFKLTAVAEDGTSWPVVVTFHLPGIGAFFTIP